MKRQTINNRFFESFLRGELDTDKIVTRIITLKLSDCVEKELMNYPNQEMDLKEYFASIASRNTGGNCLNC